MMKVLFPDKKLAIVCFSWRGRREKMIELQLKMFKQKNILVVTKENWGPDKNKYPDFVIKEWTSYEHVAKALDEFDPDIVHAYVDNTVLAAISLKMKFPTVIDTHDCAELRGQEDISAKYVYGSDAPEIFSAQGMADFICQKYGERPYSIILNLPPEKWLDYERKPKLEGNNIVYFGGISKLEGKFGYRYYKEIFRHFIENGINVHIYPAQNGVKLDWPGCIWHETINGYPDIYTELSQYQVGFVGYNDIGSADRKILDYCKIAVPNKAFDYMMAGIPTLSYNLGEAEKYVRQWGVSVNNTADLPEAFYMAKSLKIDYSAWQKRFTIDRHLDELVTIYRLVLEKPNERRIPAKISLCMIVRDEEKNLPKCLESVKNFVDEKIVLDTGSSDNTREIARNMGAILHSEEWQGNFSYHRNRVIAQATHPWIMVMDADEYLPAMKPDQIRNIKIAINKMPTEITGLSVEINDVDPEGNLRLKQNGVRIFRAGSAHYQGIVHNEIVISGLVVPIDLKIIHTGYNDDSLEKKYIRSEKLLQKRIKDKPFDWDAWYYLANLYFEKGSIKEGMKCAKECFNHLPPGMRRHSDVTYFTLYYSMAMVYIDSAIKESDKSVKLYYIQEAIKYAQTGLSICKDDPDLNFAMTLIAAHLTVIYGEQYLANVNKEVEGWRYLLTTGGKYQHSVRSALMGAYHAIGNPEKAMGLIE